MLSSIELIDLAKHRQGDVTDYRIAKILGVPPSTISNYRVGRSAPANAIAMRLAALCGLDAAEVVAWVNLERATSPEDREVWEIMLSRLSATSKRKKAS